MNLIDIINHSHNRDDYRNIFNEVVDTVCEYYQPCVIEALKGTRRPLWIDEYSILHSGVGYALSVEFNDNIAERVRKFKQKARIKKEEEALMLELLAQYGVNATINFSVRELIDKLIYEV